MLTAPAIVAAAENDFIPVCIFNNQPGNDREVLKRFREPAWNFQVARFIDASGKDIIPRKAGVSTLRPFAARMVETLTKAKRPVPPELKKAASR